MRPIDKGDSPGVYKDYPDAQEDLLNKIGYICSYCEMNISNVPAVEHVVPKSKEPRLRNQWGNFLLACTYCNSAKNDNNDSRDDYYFPDEVNTAYIFEYSKDKVIVPNDLLNGDEKKMARRTIELVKINRTSLEARKLGVKQNRELLREGAWSKAEMSYAKFKETCSRTKDAIIIENSADDIAGRAVDSFTSIWMKVFEGEPLVLNKIIANSKGLRKECFDKDGRVYKHIEIST